MNFSYSYGFRNNFFRNFKLNNKFSFNLLNSKSNTGKFSLINFSNKFYTTQVNLVNKCDGLNCAMSISNLKGASAGNSNSELNEGISVSMDLLGSKGNKKEKI